ncbi:hypothetical protein evm_009303 [Chilo suppressalis]|nr:hypothetical protein evm_009303 [Chilo suppressalis]
MGSATVSNAKPQTAMAETEKRSLKKLLRVLFKKDKKKEKSAPTETDGATIGPQPQQTSAQAVESILEKIKQLDIKKEASDSREEDELENFSFKPISDDDVTRPDRSQSNSSGDSGFIEKYVPESEDDEERDKSDDVIVSFEKLNLKDGKKEKRVQTVVLARAPIRNKVGGKQIAPYDLQPTDACRQIQINKHTLTGGQVIVNPRHVDFLEFDNATKQVQQSSEHSQHEYGGEYLNIIAEYIREVWPKNSFEETNMLAEFLPIEELQSESLVLTPPHQPPEISQPNPIEEFTYHIQNEFFSTDVPDLTILNELAEIPSDTNNHNQYFLTPPHSVNAYSPMSDSASYKNSEYTYSPERSSTLSPERSSPIHNSDYEKFQDITPYEDTASKKNVERKDSTSSMTLKQYKDMQREITQSFSKKDCCLLERTTCKQIFLEYLQRLSQEERKNMCFKVVRLDLSNAYGVLQNILISLSQGPEKEDLQYALFCMVCERVLAQKPQWLVDDFGLNLLKSAALRCPNRPELTRYLVQCVRNAIRHDSSLIQGRESVFHEVDALGDTLLIACVRRGDACADVLGELTRRSDNDDMPLFKVNHVNADGASALHVACSEHSAACPRLHCAHILLTHAAADVWQGDAKGGDTALHMAVNSRTCDLPLIMVIFSHLNRKDWKKLAHAPNTCSKSPLENARSAMRSPSRENYPPEVLEFLKKCR